MIQLLYHHCHCQWHLHLPPTSPNFQRSKTNTVRPSIPPNATANVGSRKTAKLCPESLRDSNAIPLTFHSNQFSLNEAFECLPRIF